MTNMQANYLVAIVMCGNFRDAAEALFVTPSTISQSMAALEAEYGAQLLLRTRGGIVLTPLGEQLYLIARDIVKRFQDAEMLKTSAEDGARRPDVVFGVFGTGLRRCLRPILLKHLLSAAEDAHLSVRDVDLSDIPALLREDKLRFAVVSAPSSYYRSFSEEFSCQILTRMNMMLQISTDNPLGAQGDQKFDPVNDLGAYSLAELSTYDFVFPSCEMLHIMEEQVPTFPWKRKTVLVSSDMELLSDLIRDKNAVSVSFDDHVFPRQHNDTVFIPMQMNHHFLNMHCFVIAKDIKALGPDEKFIISEIRRCIFRQAF